MAYKIILTEKADELIHKIILYVTEHFEKDVVLEKLNTLETSLLALRSNPYMGIRPQYCILRRQGYLVLILEKNLVFSKVNEHEKIVTIYAVVDQRQDYLSIIRGL